MPVRAFVVDDSEACRCVLRQILEAQGDIEVIGEACDGFQAVPLVENLQPDVVTMDLDMPGPDGFETIAHLMHRHPVPILVVTAAPLGPRSHLAFRAVAEGALDIMSKPSIADADSCDLVRARARACARVPVFRHIPDEMRSTLPAPPPAADGSRSKVAGSGARPPVRIVAMAVGTGGGPDAAEVLGRLPRGLDCAVALAAHVPVDFVPAFAEFLRRSTKMPVDIVEEGTRPCRPGTVYLSGEDRSLVCKGGGLMATPRASKRADYLPATALFRSVAQEYGGEAAGAVLSGLELDGAEGLRAMRAKGALTFAEDPDHARRPEMPRGAVEAGAAEYVLHRRLLAERLAAAVRRAA